MSPHASAPTNDQSRPLHPPMTRKDHLLLARIMSITYGLSLLPLIGGPLAFLYLARGVRRYLRATQRAHLRWHLASDARQTTLEETRISAPYVVERIRMRAFAVVMKQMLFQLPVLIATYAAMPRDPSFKEALAVVLGGQMLGLLVNVSLGAGLLLGLARERRRLLGNERGLS